MTCDFCGLALPGRVLVCPCGRLRYGKRVAALAREAEALEASDPARAREQWREALTLLPAEIEQASQIRARIATLEKTTGVPHATPSGKKAGIAVAALGVGAAALKSAKLIPMVLSMAASVLFYASTPGGTLSFALGLVGLIWVHEMGHVVANAFFGIPITAPLFIPGLGAFIRLKTPYKNVVQEAWGGLGGPLLGSLGAYLVLLAGERAGSELLREVGRIGLLINLFNLIPIHPLDGGRASMILTPALWGLATAVIAVAAFVLGEPFVLILCFFPLPRVLEGARALRNGGRGAEYYEASLLERLPPTLAYVGLAAAILLTAPPSRSSAAKALAGDEAPITSAR
jgi:Zn-dependent protease